jgi:class 3 adenylate cyclase
VVTPIDLKCGIENGQAFFHYFNRPTRNSVIVLGSTLNFASRLEGLAKYDQIIVSKDLKAMIEEFYELRKKKIPKKDIIKSYKEVKFVYVLEGRRKGVRPNID